MNALIEILNSSGRGFVHFAGPMLLQSTLLIAVLLGLDRLLRKHARAVVRYALLALILVKLVLPPSLALPSSPGYWLAFTRSAHAQPPLEISPEPKSSTPVEPVSSAPALSQPPTLSSSFSSLSAPQTVLSWQAGLFLLWLAGVAVLLSCVIHRSRYVARLVAQGIEAPATLQDLLEVCRARLSIRRKVLLKLSGDSSSPSVCGVLKPVILVPKALAKSFSHEQLEAVMLHELGHIKRGDLWVNHFQTLLQILYWFHPLLWVANAVLRRVREEAVDELVMVTMHPRSEIYPATLLAVAKFGFTRQLSGLGLVGIAESSGGLKERIQQLISRPIPKTSRLSFAGALACLFVAALLLPMARGAAPKQDGAGLPRPKGEGRGEGNGIVRASEPVGNIAAPQETGWSEPIEGVSVRLNLDGTRWNINETPSLTLDMRNQGQRNFITYQLQEMGSLEVDGVWYHWVGAGSWNRTPLPPGAHFEGMLVTPTPDWRPKQDGVTNTRPYLPLKLLPGQHTVRFAITLTDAKAPRTKALKGLPPVIVTSNPVEFELVASVAAAGTSHNAPRTMPPIASPGVSVTLRSDHFAWTVEDAVLFHASVQNQGTNEFTIAQAQETGELELDGVTYQWGGDIDVKSSALPPGRQYTNIAVTLTDRWRATDGTPLRIINGRHTVRFVMLATPSKDQGGTPPLRAVSNPIQINLVPGIRERATLIKKYLPEFELRAVRRGTGDQESIAEVLATPAGTELDLESLRRAWRGTSGLVASPGSPRGLEQAPSFWRNSKLTELLPTLKLSLQNEQDAEGVARLIFGLCKGPYAVSSHALKAERSETGWVVTPNYTGPPAQVIYQSPLELIVEDGIVRDVRERGFYTGGLSPNRVKNAGEAGWGEAVGGLSVRLQSDKPIWYLAESLALRLSVRNLGKEPVLVPESQELGELEMDGVWYAWLTPPYVARKPLAPGSQFENISVIPTTWDWRKDSKPIHSQEGKHTFRFAVPVGPADAEGKRSRAISNPVETEFRFGVSPRPAVAP